ncbi:MAG TPA: phosphotransferase [Ilumatobacter sp.]
MIHLEPAWLASQRWFRSKQRPIARIDEIDRAVLSERAALVVIGVSYGDGAPDERYLAPLVGDREPADDDGAWRALAHLMTSGTALAGERGRFEATPSVNAAALLTGMTLDDCAERRLRVEQSNTSVVLGERVILKLYRLLERGENPDVEVNAFLTAAGFADTPAVLGSLTYVDSAGTRSAAAMLQVFVRSHGDAWAAMLGALAADPPSATRIAAEVGELTHRLHVALASNPDDPAFPVRAATVDEVRHWRTSAEHQLRLALSAVTGDASEQLAGLAPQVRASFAEGFGLAAGTTPVSRIHGDYHLGQLLARTGGGYSVIDFEGEPARPLPERRTPASPLRDVAGMLRSLDYAARTAAPDSTDELDATGWLAGAQAAFLTAYGGEFDRGLLAAFELEKACYEVHYEANNRPDWLWLPLAAVARLTTR